MSLTQNTLLSHYLSSPRNICQGSLSSSFFFVFLWTKTKSRSVNARKNDLFCLRDGKESQLFLKQATSAGKVGSSGQSECRTRFILPTGTASSIIILSSLCHRNREKLWLDEPLEYRIYLADLIMKSLNRETFS